ncbi:hypothetical protein VTN77DRAFT_6353 [Rasamsonia byssochlamydoides]|uniref:uncharacterized protein n=1 Tax=Rasamsonia byssochlamydoides TaxID=89139 RepID=UPI003743D02A
MAGSSFTRTASTPASKKTSFSSTKRSSATKRNSSILNFFKKTDGPPKSTQPRITEFGIKVVPSDNGSKNGCQSNKNGALRGDDQGSGGLFLEDKKGQRVGIADNNVKRGDDVEWFPRERSKTPDDIWGNPDSPLKAEDAGEPEDEKRFNENEGSVKRRKVESPTPLGGANSKAQKRQGPFIDESDSEGEDLSAFRELDVHLSHHAAQLEMKGSAEVSTDSTSVIANERSTAVEPPSLVRAATSNAGDDCDDAVADDLDDIEDEFEGEDFLEGPWMEEEGNVPGLDEDDKDAVGECREQSPEVPTCPICQANLGGLSDSEASVHVNGCLDGKQTSFPTKSKPTTSAKGLTRSEKAAIARPAQRNPFTVDDTGSTSAFSKLMAGNAEDTAWATAAANEAASRGKQAYERTCPFYKIIPGFSICVDAFRYGRVEGCQAYFLSHFHSDHYAGLTASWRHGPIYCSKVTGNLVRQQLKVDPKWVVDLEFEKKTEVLGTNGVQVTMIPANHCPGSALFLFEKVTGKGPSARTQRVLHCGDFRASPTHVQHPLLRPEVIDEVTGKPQQQRIDVCYLDTTYLNPKYAFPSQEDVIKACADMCVRLNEDRDETLDKLDYQKRGQGGSAITKFLSSETETGKSKDEGQKGQPASRGRLLVVIGTYSIGKERICVGIARALKCKIYAPPAKQRVCACLEDPELSSLLTDDPLEAQIHMQIMFEIRAETLAEYLQSLKPHFSRVVGFRPTGWNYRPPGGRLLDNPPVSAVLHSRSWKTPFSVQDLVPQRGSTRESACFGVPYSEHSSFRELTMFCCALRIGRVIPTVNVGSRKSREKMKAWIERCEAEKRKSGLFAVSGKSW